MKFIHSDNEDHNPVDIEKVEHIQKSEYNADYKIVFHFNRGFTTWFYKSEKERNNTHEKVLMAIESQNITKITQL